MNGIEIDALWTKIQQGDQRSFTILYDSFASDLTRIAFGILKHQYQADEVTDDVFFKAWEKRETLFSKNGSIIGFLRKLTRDKCLDILKKNKTEKEQMVTLISSEKGMSIFENHSDDSCFAEKLETDELEALVDKFIEQTPTKQFEIFKLYKEKGMTSEEIAEETGLSEGAVRAHLHMARKKIKKYFDLG